MSFLGRNNIPMRPENSYILTSSKSNLENLDNINSSQERKINDKPKIISNNRTNNKSKKSLKKANISNYKSNYNKRQDITQNINKKNYSLFGQNDKLDCLNSQKYALETEPNKMNNFYQKINKTQNKYFNKDIIINNNKPSNNLLSKYYNNNNQNNKISIKKNKNLNINFNNNSPINGKKTIKMSFNDGRNILNYNNNYSNNVENKYQSNIKLNKVINKDYSDCGEISKENNLNKINLEMSIKNGKKKQDRNYSERSNLYLNTPINLLSSNMYINTENNINYRNTSYNNKYSTNYNLINITSPKERKNSYSNINPFQKTSKLNYQNNSNIQNLIKKNLKKQKYDYSFNQDNKIDKIYLNHFYEETFRNINDDKNMNIIPNYNKHINDDIIYKDNLTTNQSTYTNTSIKIKNLKKTIHSSNSNNKLDNENIDSFENYEELHFFIISSLQKGNFLAKNFE